MALIKLVDNPLDVGTSDVLGGPDWDAVAGWINAMKGIASGQLILSQGDNPPIAGGAPVSNVANIAYINSAQTYSATNTFSANQVLNNAVQLNFKTLDGTIRTGLQIDATDNLKLGATAGLTNFYLYTGNATQALRIDNTNTVLTSPTWGTSLVLNNNMGYLGKLVAGTNKNIIKLNSADSIIIGDTGIAGLILLSGHATNNAMVINASNVVTTSPEWGVSQVMSTGVWQQWDDAGGTPRNVLRMVNDDVYFVNTTTTGDMYFQTFAGTFMTVSEQGFITHIKPAQAATFENIVRYTVADDSTTVIDFSNTSSTDGVFAPLINISCSANLPNTNNALLLRTQVPTAQDTGSVAMLLIAARQSPAANITTRPLFECANNTTYVFRITANGDQVQRSIAQTGVGELLTQWIITDTNSNLTLLNASSADGEFVPWFRARGGLGTITNNYCFLLDAQCLAANDIGTTDIMRFIARTSTSTDITTRPLFSFRNNATEVLRIGAKGDVSLTGIATATTAEILQTWTVNDNTASFLSIRNSVSTDNIFVPRFVTNLGSTVAAQRSCYFQHYIHSSQDSGTVAVVAYDARLSTDVSVATRPLFEWYNANVKVFALLANGDTDNGGGAINNIVGSTTMSKIEGFQTLKRTGHLHGGNAISAEFGTGLFAPKGLGFYGPALAGFMLGNAGAYTGLTTLTSASGVVGYKCALYARRDRQIKLSVKARVDRQTASRFFVLLKSTTNQLTAGTTVPLLTSEGGIAIGWNETGGGTYHVWTCDALGTVTDTNTGVTIPAYSNNAEMLQLSVDSAGTTWTWEIFNTAGAGIGSGTVNTTVPTISHTLHFHLHAEVTDSTNSNLLIASGDIEMIK